MDQACILLTDLTGSTALYDRVGQSQAVQHVNTALSLMREIIEAHEGQCIKTQGDDSFGYFGAPDCGFEAARSMLEAEWPVGLDVHAGLFHGDVSRVDDDIYGDAVNMAARLTALAKPGELLVGDEAFDQMAAAHRASFLPIGRLKLKGKSVATRVYSYTVDLASGRTVMVGGAGHLTGRRTESAEFRANDRVWQIDEGGALTIGRSGDCDICLQQPWISRHHGKLELRGAQLEYTDHSSAGSSVVPADGPEYDVHRRGTLLYGEGMLFFGTRDQTTSESALHYSTNDLIPE
jgi:adenylate cyclase